MASVINSFAISGIDVQRTGKYDYCLKEIKEFTMNENDLIYWIWLSEVKGIGPVLARSLLRKFTTPKIVYNSEIEELLSINGIGPKAAQNILSNRNLRKAERILKNSLNKNIKIQK